MLDRILVPTDGSEESNKALAAAEQLARALGSEITLLRVVDARAWLTAADGDSPASAQILQDIIDQARELATADLTRLAARLTEQGIKVSSVVLEGTPAASA